MIDHQTSSPLQVNSAPLADWISFNTTTHLPPLDTQRVEQQQADRHLVVWQGDRLVGRCSLWWRQTPNLAGEKTGLIGHYAALDQSAADALLTQACEILAQQGCTVGIGPIDGNTWQSYRFVISSHPEAMAEPPFFLEPWQPKEYPQQWVNHGFRLLSRYYSTLNRNLQQRDRRLIKVQQRLERLGLEVFSPSLHQLTASLTQIHHLISISFRQQFLFTPLPLAAFRQQCELLLPYIRPELVLLAQHQQEWVGFLLAIPNWREGSQPQTVILKTIAILPDRCYAGLGQWLVEHGQLIAADAGYRRAIHALMHEANPSYTLSQHYAQPLRTYGLWQKRLQ